MLQCHKVAISTKAAGISLVAKIIGKEFRAQINLDQ
jgi:hypothetical protein